MLKIYKPVSGLDWMNYRIVREMTAHHIVKREDGGRLEMGNIAPLTEIGHRYLHIIEYKDEEAYRVINRLFGVINAQGHEPNEGERQMIEYILREFEAFHGEDLNAKGEPLIKEAYLKRYYR